jgi:CotH protein/lamin tail-like protein/type IX secretion system substrate protein
MRLIITTLFFLAANSFSLSAQDLYGSANITTVEITFAEGNWDELLNDFYTAGNGDRLLATVEINGISFDSVGIRYRGGSTYDPANVKNPLSIKLDYVKSQNYDGVEVLKLSNGAKDPSFLREVLTFEIARNYMEAPRANYASVYINGNFHGVYANVESVNSLFFANRFQIGPDNSRFECNPAYDFSEPLPTPPFGCTQGHGANLEYLGSGNACYFDHYEIQSPVGWEDLVAAASTLKNDPANARAVLDLDRFIWMSALNNLLVNLDSYLGANPRNYFIAKADNGHFVPVADDMNESFGRFPWATVPQAGDPQPPLGFYTEFDPFSGSGDDTKPLLKAIFNNPAWKRMYVAHLRTMMAEMFTIGWFGQRTEELQSLISDELMSDANHFYTHDEFLENLNGTVVDSYNGEDAYGLFPLMDGRIVYLQGLPEFQATPPAITDYHASPVVPTPGTTVTLTAAVSNASTVYFGYRDNLREVFELAQMFDDGAHGDGPAGDGVYGASVLVGAGGLQFYFYAENEDAGSFRPPRAEFEFFSLGAAGNVVINEIMAANQTTVADQDGQFDDWAEFYNNTAGTMNLSGWYLSDDPLVPDKWAFPNGTFIDAGSYLTVWVDDDELQAGLHTSFNLAASGEQLLLLNPSLEIVDQVVFGSQAPDISLGRCPNGTGAFTSISPTFGEDNNSACTVPTNDVRRLETLKIYPNPAREFVVFQNESTIEVRVRLVSPRGRIVKDARFSGSLEIAVGDLPAGLYFVEMDGYYVEKLMIVR